MNRFAFYVCMAFVTAFVGVSWAARGFPTYLPHAGGAGQLQPTLDVTFGDNKSEKKRELLVEQQLQDPNNFRRDPLRLDALQAANGYALSSCDKTIKANFVAAVRAYAAADLELRKCNVFFSNCDATFDKANAVYSTPLDLRVRAAMHEAFEKGGISKADFPPEMQMTVMSLATSTGDPVSACANQAEAKRQ
jgi:hypothetical protein